MRTKLFALVAVVGMLGMAVGPGVAAAAQTDSGNETTDDSLSVSVDSEHLLVEVTKNDTDVANATVDVAVAGDGNYSGTDTYTTNEKGTVMLDAPSENVTVDVTATAGNETASTTATLTVENGTNSGTFGTLVSTFVQSLQSDNQTAIGQQVADFVTANNPGNAPDHAGPPENAGPPEHAGPGAENETANESDGERGPPEHAGNDKDGGPGADKGNGNGNGNDPGNGNGNGSGNGNGNAGGPADDSDGEEAETETETEA